MIFTVSVDVEEIPLKGNSNDYTSVVDGVPLLLDLFDDLGVSSTFFVTKDVAKDATDTILEAARCNHEIACHGEHGRLLDSETLKYDYGNIKRATETITNYLNLVPVGFRAPFHKVDEATLKALIKLGYKYDSSVTPSSRLLDRHFLPNAPKTPYNPCLEDLCRNGSSPIVEIPISSLPVANIPLGLSYMRLLGLRFFKFFFQNMRQDIVMLYLHTYDLFSLPSNSYLPARFKLMYKVGDGFKSLKGFLWYVSETFSPKFISAKEVLEHLHTNDG
jgi:peptidoglycan/xylan/chitin deacetylase (PgdA/CDA1 family)